MIHPLRCAAVVSVILISLVALKTRSLDMDCGNQHFVLQGAVGRKVNEQENKTFVKEISTIDAIDEQDDKMLSLKQSYQTISKFKMFLTMLTCLWQRQL